MTGAVSFFPDAPDRPVPDDGDDSLLLSSSGWQGPPWHVRPGVAALSVVVGRSQDTAVLLEGARAYPQGVVLRLVVRVCESGREARRRLFAHLERVHGRGQLDLWLPPGGLRWGVELADGRRVTTMDESPWAGLPDGADPREWSPDHPVLEGLGRPGGWADTWCRDVWLWPLPPAGRVRVVCAWDDRGIPETAVEVDAAPLREAAARAEPLWG